MFRDNTGFVALFYGSPVFVYAMQKELMVDTSTLRMALMEMGEKVSVSLDKQGAAVTIEAQ